MSAETLATPAIRVIPADAVFRLAELRRPWPADDIAAARGAGRPAARFPKVWLVLGDRPRGSRMAGGWQGATAEQGRLNDNATVISVGVVRIKTDGTGHGTERAKTKHGRR
jgi:hypothetical protein